MVRKYFVTHFLEQILFGGPMTNLHISCSHSCTFAMVAFISCPIFSYSSPSPLIMLHVASISFTFPHESSNLTSHGDSPYVAFGMSVFAQDLFLFGKKNYRRNSGGTLQQQKT